MLVWTRVDRRRRQLERRSIGLSKPLGAGRTCAYSQLNIRRNQPFSEADQRLADTFTDTTAWFGLGGDGRRESYPLWSTCSLARVLARVFGESLWQESFARVLANLVRVSGREFWTLGGFEA